MRGSQNGADTDRAGALQIAQKPPRVGRRLRFEDADEHPSCGSTNGHEEIPAAVLIGHLRQVIHVDMDVSRLISLEGAVLRLLFLGREIAQVSHAMPPQAAVQPGTRGVRVQKLPQRAIEGAIGSSPMASATRSSSETSSVLRSATATASWAGVSVVCRRCGVWLRSAALSRLRHF